MTTPILLLHGQPGTARDWAGVLAALGPLASSAVVPDRPGWDGVRAAAGLAANAEASLAALDSRRVDRAIVVGHSFGGAVAAWLAAHHPERVRGLVLVAPSANRASLYSLDHLLATPVAGDLLGAVLLGVGGLGLSLPALRRRLAQALALDEPYLARAGRRLVRPTAWRAFMVEQRALVRELPLLENELGRIAVPTRILAGTRDRIVPLGSQRRLRAQIHGSEVVLLEGADHLLPLRRPGAVAEAVLAVAAVTPGSAAGQAASPGLAPGASSSPGRDPGAAPGRPA